MSIDVEITFLNQSDDNDRPEIVVFMQQAESNFSAYSTAWQVIKNVGYNSWHKFKYTIDTEAQVTWDNGSSGTLPISVENGKNYALEDTPGGFSLKQTGTNKTTNEFDVLNKVSTDGGICVIALKDKKVIARKEQVGKNQKAEFVFHPKIYFGITSEYEEGDIISSAVMSDNFTEISLEGLKKLTVVLTGNPSDGYSFETQNQIAA